MKVIIFLIAAPILVAVFIIKGIIGLIGIGLIAAARRL